MHVKRNTEVCSQLNCCCAKETNITYSDCVSVVLIIKHAKCMNYIILSPVACPPVPYFSTLSHKRLGFRVSALEH